MKHSPIANRDRFGNNDVHFYTIIFFKVQLFDFLQFVKGRCSQSEDFRKLIAV